jgi:soluble lytic murein transglycosylase-like protein
MPGTAAELKVNPLVWTQNVYGGIRYLARMRDSFKGDLRKALAAYNWGPGNLRRAIHAYGEAWEDQLPAETAGYLRKILEPEPAAPARTV